MHDEMIGRRFGRLTVVEYDHPGRNGPYYICECDCGNRRIVSKNNLKTGNSTSCGCARRKDDLLGRRFGRLIVRRYDHVGNHGRTYYVCECDCGNESIVSRAHLLNGHVTSCGCWNRDSRVTHGLTDSPVYHTWVSMRQRCNNPKSTSYDRYGARGITVCEEWDNFETFHDWAMSNGYKTGLTIDRKNNDKGYCPDNCRWADSATQANNRHTNRFVTYNGITHTASEWARLLNVNYATFLGRLNRNDMRDFEEYYGVYEEEE